MRLNKILCEMVIVYRISDHILDFYISVTVIAKERDVAPW